MKMNKGKIGIFDSGFGGLSILKEIVKVLPNYDYIYLGDTARAPYGNRSQEIIYKFTKEGIDFLFKNGAEIIILACNTASSEALRKIQQVYLPKYHKDKKVLGVIIPASEDAVLKTKNKRIGVLATVATVESGAFKREIQKLDKSIKVYEVPAPLLVPIVEAGEDKSDGAKRIIKSYVDKISKYKIDTLILGCTHYGILEKEIENNVAGINIISEGKIVAQKFKDYLQRHHEISDRLSKKKTRVFYTTDSREKFDDHGSRFFGTKIHSKTIES
jgi:glutamate racemase